MRSALGVIEVIGLGTAITALDAACKAADVTLVGYDKVVGVNKAISVVVNVAGEVAAVKAAVEAAIVSAGRVGTVVSTSVLARPHEELDVLIEGFAKNLKKKVVKEEESVVETVEAVETVTEEATVEQTTSENKSSHKNDKKNRK